MQKKFIKSSLILGIILFFSIQLFSCGDIKEEPSEKSNSTEITTTSSEETPKNTNDESKPEEDSKTITETSSNKNTETSKEQDTNKIKSKEEALKVLKIFLDYRDPMTLTDANNNYVDNNNIKRDYYAFFLEYNGTTTRLFLVKKSTGEIFELSQNAQIQNVKTYSLQEAKNHAISYIDKNQGGFDTTDMTFEEADSKYFAKDLNIDQVKKNYYVFFLEWNAGGTKVYLVNKVTGDIFDYSVTGEIKAYK